MTNDNSDDFASALCEFMEAAEQLEDHLREYEPDTHRGRGRVKSLARGLLATRRDFVNFVVKGEGPIGEEELPEGWDTDVKTLHN